MIGTFVMCLMVVLFLFVLALMGRTAETFASGGAGVVV